MLGTDTQSECLSPWLIWARGGYRILLSGFLGSCQYSSVCWESYFLTHGWRSVPVVVEKQLLWSWMTLELQPEHLNGFAFKVLNPRPDLDQGRRLRSVSRDGFLQVDQNISLVRVRDRGQMVDYFETRFPVIVYR